MNESIEYIPFSMENIINNKTMKHWMRNNWHLSIFFVVFYLASIFLIQRSMKTHPPFRLNGIFFLWNFTLAIFSISASIRILPLLVINLTSNGTFGFTCYYSDIHRIFDFWMWLFAFSKVVELGDTLFIALQKKNLLFLHYYHHSVTLIVTWMLVMELNSICLWYASMNYLVPAFIYTYFALGLLKWNIPRILALLITSLQLIQMLIGVLLTLLVMLAKYRRHNYHSSNEYIMTTTFFMYLTYIVLFGKLFRDKYLSIFQSKRKFE